MSSALRSSRCPVSTMDTSAGETQARSAKRGLGHAAPQPGRAQPHPSVITGRIEMLGHRRVSIVGPAA